MAAASDKTPAEHGRKGPPLLTERYELMMPAVLPRALKVAAEKNLTTASEYIRRAVIERLRQDGIDLTVA